MSTKKKVNPNSGDEPESEGTKAFRELMDSGVPPSALAIVRLQIKYGDTIRFPKNMGETIQGVK
jgi:hypothetical protein